jgi:hypothetical protein
MRLKKKRDFIIRGAEEFDRRWVKTALTDPFIYLLGIAFLTSSVAINGFGVFLPTIISGLGLVPTHIHNICAKKPPKWSRFAALKVNYMSIAVYIVGAISLTIQVYFSDKFRKRGMFIIGCCIPVAIGYLICVGTPNPNAGNAGMFILVIGQFYLLPTLLCLELTLY